jgi:HlyD family secretion protein
LPAKAQRRSRSRTTDAASVESARAAIEASRAQVAASDAAIATARSQVIGARSNVEAARVTIRRIDADIADSALKAPREGRIQYRVAQPGEVVAGGGKVLNLVDLSDVYMTFFLPETATGRVGIGSEIRIVLDAAPRWVVPARASFVADVAQFTPKTVETASERQKLMFRVKARIAPELLRRHIRQVKTGLPGMAYVKIDDAAAWPAKLTVNVAR